MQLNTEIIVVGGRNRWLVIVDGVREPGVGYWSREAAHARMVNERAADVVADYLARRERMNVADAVEAVAAHWGIVATAFAGYLMSRVPADADALREAQRLQSTPMEGHDYWQ